MRKKIQQVVRVSGREQMAQKYLVLVLRETGIQQTCKLQSRSVATTGPPQHGHTAPAPSLFITFFLRSNTWNILIFVFFFFLYFHHWYLIPWCLYCWSRNIYIYIYIDRSLSWEVSLRICKDVFQENSRGKWLASSLSMDYGPTAFWWGPSKSVYWIGSDGVAFECNFVYKPLHN